MSAASKLWGGLVVLAIVWVIANLVMTERVESEISAQATASLDETASLIDRPSIAAAGRDVTLGGGAFTPQAGEDAARAAATSPGVRLVHETTVPIPSAKPYVFTARRDGSNLLLTGHVPLPAVRERIVETALRSLPGIAVIDRTTYALGAPDNFAAIAAYGVAQAARLVDGTLSLSDAAYSIAGATWTPGNFDAAITATRTLPPGANLAKTDILPPGTRP
jgi:OOP family OmpA-OmpF porin